ncbi:uncharacterized protein PHACADRAFT_133484 [Phanerochaete carnosa HHB-10118-sp]|uniref:Uncharacterized protein n=1 Tax=Phanerochaete carnosa (strain HHB-10118-sp) TaxID=650164 RepID=K5W9W0_PHACS|nr:uncharacterized protein PHACADRAFT_133484 [Phanerochaete carnosa HHB-10118-sp]EKM60743.1 hypothetical protein PHACADRAFT_133484 [Phanerochaete carnosa HHB-10118-sp]
MARATRSTANQEKEKPAETPQSGRKSANKKRKRSSAANESDLPAAKAVRTDEDIKEEDTQDGQELQTEEVVELELPSSGDVPIQDEDAEKILEVLEIVDTQGLLDRIFPLPTEHSSGSGAGSSAGTQSYSFRALLKSPRKFPLKILRTAVHHLFPISSHPRSRPSAPAAEQLKFCNLALSLLSQASHHSAPVPLNAESLLTGHSGKDDGHDDESKSQGRWKYALVQRLPTGDWWSSANSPYPSLSLEGKDIKSLGTGYAELVSIFPSAPVAEGHQPTLGSYIKKRPPVHDAVQEPRRLSCGKFLDYGPNTSFAPSFDGEGVEVGQSTLSEVVYFRQRDKDQIRMQRKQLKQRQDATMEDISEVVEVEKPLEDKPANPDSSLEGLLSSEEVVSIKQALGSLELEKAIEELLQRNARALVRLELLQAERLLNEGGSKPVEIGSEEWNAAQGILDSLTMLASLRPRPSSGAKYAPLVPTVSVLRSLHRTLPIGTSKGWFGSLPEGRTVALRDDTTLRVRSGATAPTPAPAPPTPAPATPATQKTTAAPYNFAYPAYAAAGSQYRGGYGSYPPAQNNYYPNYQAGTPVSATTHYPNQQFPATGTQAYPYSSWYNYQPPQGSTTPSGQATPATPTATVPSSYASFFANTQQPQPQRAVANTVLTGKPYQASGWSTGSGTAYVAPLPSHLRTAIPAASSPGTPQPASATSTYSGYYAGYQPSQPAAR